MASYCFVQVNLVIYGKLNGNCSPLSCSCIEGVVRALEVCYFIIKVIAVAVIHVDNTAGFVINAEGYAISLTVICLVERATLEAVCRSSKLIKASGILTNKISVKVDVVCTADSVLNLCAGISATVSIGNLVGNNVFCKSVKSNACSRALIIKIFNGAGAYCFFDLNCYGRSTIAGLNVIGYVKVINACSGNENLTKLFAKESVIRLVNTYGVNSVILYSKSESYVMSS